MYLNYTQTLSYLNFVIFVSWDLFMLFVATVLLLDQLFFCALTIFY